VGSGTEIQYRNGSAFGAVAGSSWDATTLALPKISATSTTANQLTVGYDATYNVTLNVSSAGVMTLAGYKPSGTNVAAGAAYIDAPVSTGTGTPGSLVFRSTVATTSGSTAQTLADTLTISGGNAVFGSEASYYPTPTPLRVSLGGTYGTSTPGSFANLKWIMFTDSPGSNVSNYGIGMSVNLMEFQVGASAGMGFYCNAGEEAMKIASDSSIAIGKGSGVGVAPDLSTRLRVIGPAVSSSTDFTPVNTLTLSRSYLGSVSYSQNVAFALCRWENGPAWAARTQLDVKLTHGIADETNVMTLRSDGKIGFSTTLPDRQVEINSTTGDCLRLTYNDANGSATYYTDFAVSAAGNLTITPSGGSVSIAGDLNMGANTVHYGTTESTQTPTGTTATISLHTGNHHTLDCGSASGDVTLTLTVPPGPCSGTLIIKQGATARDITWTPSAGTVVWLGTEPTWNADTSKTRIVAWRWDAAILYLSATDASV
jgi:hypothetical protein